MKCITSLYLFPRLGFPDCCGVFEFPPLLLCRDIEAAAAAATAAPWGEASTTTTHATAAAKDAPPHPLVSLFVTSLSMRGYPCHFYSLRICIVWRLLVPFFCFHFLVFVKYLCHFLKNWNFVLELLCSDSSTCVGIPRKLSWNTGPHKFERVLNLLFANQSIVYYQKNYFLWCNYDMCIHCHGWVIQGV